MIPKPAGKINFALICKSVICNKAFSELNTWNYNILCGPASVEINDILLKKN